MIGIDHNKWLFYEGNRGLGHGIWPSPVVSVATVVKDSEGWKNVPTSFDLAQAKLIFREDSFDPVTRVRRGRLYFWQSGVLQQEWFVVPHPTEPIDPKALDHRGLKKRTLYTYYAVQNKSALSDSSSQPYLVLGIAAASTVWNIISAETIVSGHLLVTLRARSSYGVLPELLKEVIPRSAIKELAEALDLVADASFRAGPASIIDSCRAALTQILAHFLFASGQHGESVFHEDLGNLLKFYKKNQTTESILEYVVRLVQRFHSRAKPNEQKRYNTRPPTEEDAQLVLQSVGFILREIGWAR